MEGLFGSLTSCMFSGRTLNVIGAFLIFSNKTNKKNFKFCCS